MSEQQQQPPQDEASIEQEIAALQAQRVAFETRSRAKWTKGLAKIDAAIAAAGRRRDVSRAARIKADARAAEQARQVARDAAEAAAAAVAQPEEPAASA